MLLHESLEIVIIVLHLDRGDQIEFEERIDKTALMFESQNGDLDIGSVLKNVKVI